LDFGLKAGVRRGSKGQGLAVSLQERGDSWSQGIVQVGRDLWRSSNPASTPSRSNELRRRKDFSSETLNASKGGDSTTRYKILGICADFPSCLHP